LGIIPDAAVLVRGETIEAVGSMADLESRFPDESRLDAGGMAVLPGLVDPHTHLVWAGDRAAEFEMRLQGKTYMEILAAGGGILSTVKATRSASLEQLKDQTRKRAESMLAHGTTTAEVKTGYGLDIETEQKQLRVILDLDMEGPLEMAPTYLGAHAIAPEFKDDPDGYTRFICRKGLPSTLEWWKTHAANRPPPYVDAFCEKGAFDLEQSRAILSEAQRLGFPIKLHADEFENLGGASLAAELGAVSADHLVKTSPEDIRRMAASGTVAVSLPCTPFGLAEQEYTPVRQILDANGLLALATDTNPGTAWCENMQFAIALACRYLKMTPARAIAAATINAAAAIQRQDRIGSIEPGKQADLIILATTDYRHLGYRFGTNLVSTVIKKGKVVIGH
jgi:imidazolonepropionase